MALSCRPRLVWRAEEVLVESVAFMDETAQAMGQLVDLEAAGNSHAVINLASRVAVRAGLAKIEVLRLRDGGDAA
jgi:hypothetical protein